jgi:putative toxin-antitoxin system antitoxin component (TIGR02293 family)
MPSAKLRAPRKRRHGKNAVAKVVRAKRVRAATARREPASEATGVVAYHSTKGVDDYVRQVARATPLQLVEIERQGVLGSFIKDLSRRMEIPSSRIFTILGVPKATAEKKAAAGERVEGRGGQAAVGMVKLLGIAQEIVANSTASEAKTFDATKWLGRWIERPQPALGGRKPADLLDTPTGVELVARLLGSIESGAYQ